MKDIVCGMEVSDNSSYHHEHGGKVFYFCSEGCLGEFSKNPEQYLNKEAPAPKHAGDGSIIYTCPMHPEITTVHSGQLPQVRHDFGTRRSAAAVAQNRMDVPYAPGNSAG